MTIAYFAQAENSNSGGATPVATSSNLTLATGDLVEVQVAAVNGATGVAVTDGLGNSYVSQGTTNPGGTTLYTFVAQNCVSGTATPSVSAATGNLFAIYAKQIRGAATTSAALGYNGAVATGSQGSGANALVSGNVNIAVAQNVLVSGFCFDLQGGGVPIAGTSPNAFTTRTAVWATYGIGVGGAGAGTLPEDIRLVAASGNVQATFGSANVQFDTLITVVMVYAEAGVVIPPVPSRGPMPKQIYIMP